VASHLPSDWWEGWENVFFNVTCENQRRADERIPILHSLPFRHKGIMTAPLIGPITIEKYLKEGQIEQVITGGENYAGSRQCDYSWVKTLSEETVKYNVRFCFIETGSVFLKDGKRYEMPDKALQT
jgi:Phage protein Gp37/Gp68.